MTVQGFAILPVEVPHLSRLEKLPQHHRNRFERLLIAQAIETNAIAVTNDPAWKRQPLKVKW